MKLSVFIRLAILAAVLRFKPHKREGCSELSSDHLINAGHDLCILVACLMTAVTVHGFVPNVFRVSTIVPIRKGRNVNTSRSSNFMGIALCSIFLQNPI